MQSLAAGKLCHALVCRSETKGSLTRERLLSNPYLTIALGGSLSLQTLARLVPGLGRFLRVPSLGLLDVLVVGLSALCTTLVNDGLKPENHRKEPPPKGRGFRKRPIGVRTKPLL
jgi:Ca2+-transporting ATPase